MTAQPVPKRYRRESPKAWMKLGNWSETHAWRDFPAYRQEYMSAFCNAMVRWELIEAWAWAKGETEFLQPMTKPPLTDGQQAIMLCEFLCYYRRFTRIVEFIEQLWERAERVVGKDESKRLEDFVWRGKLSIPEVVRQIVEAEAAVGVYLSTADEFDPVEWTDSVDDQIERRHRDLLRRVAEQEAAEADEERAS